MIFHSYVGLQEGICHHCPNCLVIRGESPSIHVPARGPGDPVGPSGALRGLPQFGHAPAADAETRLWLGACMKSWRLNPSGNGWLYPLVNIQKAIENGHRNSGFSHGKW